MKIIFPLIGKIIRYAKKEFLIGKIIRYAKKEFLLAALGGIIALGITFYFALLKVPNTPFLDIAIHILGALGAILLVFLATVIIILFSSRVLVGRFWKVMTSRELHRNTVVELLSQGLNQVENTIGQISKEGGIMLSEDTCRAVSSSLFTKLAEYSGSDPRIPSVYLANQDKERYLDSHDKSLTRYKRVMGRDMDSYRIMVLDYEWMPVEYRHNPTSVNEFVEWHSKRNVKLKIINFELADQLRKSPIIQNIYPLDSVEVGIWYNEYCLIFDRKTPRSNQIRLSYGLVNTPMYLACIEYMKLLKEKSENFDEMLQRVKNNPLQHPLSICFTQELAKNWDYFINWDEREKTEIKFLKEILAKYSIDKEQTKILDAAAGTGFDAIKLVKEGYRIYANEVDNELCKVFSSNKDKMLSRDQRAKIESYEHQWTDMIPGIITKKFDLILLTGNSLSHLLSRPEIKRTLKNFYDLLETDGRLVVDQRNFDKLWNNRNSITSLDTFYSRFYSSKVVYCGEKVRGWPSSFDGNNNQITFEYIRTEKDRSDVVGNLKMYSFKDKELKSMLSDVGFGVSVSEYSDYERGFNPNADFYIYVAKKKN